MDPVRNPFAPGAGTQPPELAGRDEVIERANIALQRVLISRSTQSQILLGLRGVGKTVLLNKIQTLAEDLTYRTSFVEAPEQRPLAQLLYPRMHQVLRQLSFVESAKAKTHEALTVLRAFAGAFKVEMGDFSISVDPAPGVADSGDLELDLPDLFQKIGEAAAAAHSGWALFIDELQYLQSKELAALITAIHRVNQRQLPVIMFGAGLPQIAALSGNAKSYAERLFEFPPIGPLDKTAAANAIRGPIETEEEQISQSALDRIVVETRGYPYFLQEWGFQAWNAAPASPITEAHVDEASINALSRLDASFFLVRFDRLTSKEKEYVHAMAALGDGPYRSADVADQLKENLTSLGPRRAKIISKGMIYSPGHGDIDFTVPMFDDFLRRQIQSS